MTVIVTALYNVPSKFPYKQQIQWSSIFVKNAPCKTFVYCEQDTHDLLSKDANSNVNFRILDKTDFVANKYSALFEECFQKHPERNSMKSSWLAKIWYEKKEFVARAMAECSDDYFLWCDIGILRDSSCVKAFPQFGSRIDSLPKAFHILELKPCPKGLQQQKHKEVFLGGGILGAHRDTWFSVSQQQDLMLEEMASKGWDIVKDQSVWLNVIAQNAELFVKHKPQQQKVVKNRWFAMLGIL